MSTTKKQSIDSRKRAKITAASIAALDGDDDAGATATKAAEGENQVEPIPSQEVDSRHGIEMPTKTSSHRPLQQQQQQQQQQQRRRRPGVVRKNKAPTQLLVVGHEDGVITIWDCSPHNLHVKAFGSRLSPPLLQCVNTRSLFLPSLRDVGGTSSIPEFSALRHGLAQLSVDSPWRLSVMLRNGHFGEFSVRDERTAHAFRANAVTAPHEEQTDAAYVFEMTKCSSGALLLSSPRLSMRRLRYPAAFGTQIELFFSSAIESMTKGDAENAPMPPGLSLLMATQTPVCEQLSVSSDENRSVGNVGATVQSLTENQRIHSRCRLEKIGSMKASSASSGSSVTILETHPSLPFAVVCFSDGTTNVLCVR